MKPSLNLVFLGKQGVGKGTYAQRVSEKFSIPQVSTGDLLREESKKPTVLGAQIAKQINAGHLISDEAVLDLLKRRLAQPDCKGGFILDGFPRNIRQAELLEKTAEELKKSIGRVVLFSASDKVLLQRLGGRIQCRICGKIYHLKNLKPKVPGKCDLEGGELYVRDDDKKEAIQKRFELFEAQTRPVIDFYRKKKRLVEVDAEQSVDTVVKELVSKLNELFKGK